jgi:hypothetical protein
VLSALIVSFTIQTRYDDGGLDLPGTSAWTMGLLIGINMIVGGASLMAMGLHARSGSPALNLAFQRQA